MCKSSFFLSSNYWLICPSSSTHLEHTFIYWRNYTLYIQITNYKSFFWGDHRFPLNITNFTYPFSRTCKILPRIQATYYSIPFLVHQTQRPYQSANADRYGPKVLGEHTISHPESRLRTISRRASIAKSSTQQGLHLRFCSISPTKSGTNTGAILVYRCPPAPFSFPRLQRQSILHPPGKSFMRF